MIWISEKEAAALVIAVTAVVDRESPSSLGELASAPLSSKRREIIWWNAYFPTPTSCVTGTHAGVEYLPLSRLHRIVRAGVANQIAFLFPIAKRVREPLPSSLEFFISKRMLRRGVLEVTVEQPVIL